MRRCLKDEKKYNGTMKPISELSYEECEEAMKLYKYTSPLDARIILHRIGEDEGEIFYDREVERLLYRDKHGNIRDFFSRREGEEKARIRRSTEQPVSVREKKLIDKAIYFGIYTNGECCYKYNGTISEFDKSDCKNNHNNPDESEMYTAATIKIEEEILVPLTLISKNNVMYYNYNGDGTVSIKEKGYYRITYNILYSGKMKSVRSYIKMGEEKIPYSYSVNRMARNDEDEGDELESQTNHTFYMPVKSKGDNRIRMVIKVESRKTKQGVPKEMKIYPVNTWMSIEKVCELETEGLSN